MRFMKKNKGFTLAEMFLVSAMLAVISLAIYTTFTNGIKIWQKVNTEMLEEDVCIFFERFSSDLRNSFRFEGMGFSGKEDMIGFSTFIKDPSSGRNIIGQVLYSYRPATGVLIREGRDFSRIYSGRPGVVTQQLENIAYLKFEYYFYDDGTKKYVWHDKCLEGRESLTVRVEIKFHDKGEEIRFFKTVVIPVYG